jgi:zeaxanthin glucosyltransferase
LPDTFHYVGPIRKDSANDHAFPWEKLNGKPLIYASLGTVVNRNRPLYRLIAEACAELQENGVDAQLVLALGGADPALLGDVPGSPIVVRYAPQRQLLAKSWLTITHAGLNTTLESLSEGVPLVALPIAFEQPAVAARIRWTRTGEFASPSSVNAAKLRQMIIHVGFDPTYRQSAARMKAAMAATDGGEHAADIIEAVAETGKPVSTRTHTTPHALP